MARTDVLIIGSNNKPTGGIPRYIPEQLQHLPDSVTRRVYDIGAPEGSGFGWFIASLCLSLFDTFRFPIRTRPDVVHVHTSQRFSFYRAAFYVLFSRYVWRVPVLLHVHGSSFDEFINTDSTFVSALQTIVYNASSEIIVLSRYWKEQLEPHTDPDKITITPNAVDPDDYDPTYDADPPEIVFVSNLIERKGVTELIGALETILSANSNSNPNPTVRVRIAGKGPLSGNVEALAATYDSVEYLGYVSEEEKYTLLSESSIYVLPAYAEGLPIAILEAMAGGNAIVSTTVGSIPEVIERENGRLVPPRDADALARELRDLVDNPEEVRAMGRRNRHLVETRYCWDVVANELTTRYETLTENAPN